MENNEEYVKKYRSAYDKFMKQYNEDHAACPKCGSTKYATTLVGYIFNHDKPEEYKDMNNCTCSECGDKHIYHDRVKKKEENES